VSRHQRPPGTQRAVIARPARTTARVACALLCMLSTAPANAAPTRAAAARHAPTGDAALSRADVDRGVRAMAARDYLAAREAFARAYARSGDVEVLWNLAVAELKADDPAAALKHFRDYVANPKGRVERRKQGASSMIPIAYAATGHLRISSTAKIERVTVDGDAVAAWDRELDVTAGRHELRFSFNDETTSVATVEATAGVVVSVVAELPEKAAPPLPETPTVRQESSALQPSTVIVTAAHGEVSKRPAVPAAGRGWAVAGIGFVAAALAGGGSYMLYRAHSERQDALALGRASDQPPCAFPTSTRCRAMVEAVSSEAIDRSFARGFLIGSGALAVGAIVTWFVWPKDLGESTLRVKTSGGAWGLEAVRHF